jgi:hypothetical protein
MKSTVCFVQKLIIGQHGPMLSFLLFNALIRIAPVTCLGIQSRLHFSKSQERHHEDQTSHDRDGALARFSA